MDLLKVTADQSAGNSPVISPGNIVARPADCLGYLAGFLGKNPELMRLQYRDFDVIEIDLIVGVFVSAKFSHTVYDFGTRTDKIRYDNVTINWQVNAEGNWEELGRITEPILARVHCHSDKEFTRRTAPTLESVIDRLNQSISEPSNSGQILPGAPELMAPTTRRHSGGITRGGSRPEAISETPAKKAQHGEESISQAPAKKPSKSGKRRHGRGRK